MSIKEKEKYMTDIWTDPQHPAAFTGPEKLYQIIRKEGRFKIGRGTIKKFLEKKCIQFTKTAKKTFSKE